LYAVQELHFHPSKMDFSPQLSKKLEPSNGEKDEDATSPPIGLVVVRETPPRSAGRSVLSGSSRTTSASNHSSSAGRAPPFSSIGAFRLQPRGKNSKIATPSPSRSNAAGAYSGGRKRGAQCLATTSSSSPQSFLSLPGAIQRRALFSPTEGSTSTSSASGSSSAAAVAAIHDESSSHQSNSFLRSPSHHNTERTSIFLYESMLAESPSRVENAMQSLTIKSPAMTPPQPLGSSPSESQTAIKTPLQPQIENRDSSPFMLYSSTSPATVKMDASSVMHRRNRGESIGSVGSASRSSPRIAPLTVIRQHEYQELQAAGPDGEKKPRASPQFHQHPSAMRDCSSSYVISLESKRDVEEETPICASTPPRPPPPPDFVQCVNHEAHPFTATPAVSETRARSMASPHGLHTPSSKRTLPSPHDTSLPSLKLTPRRRTDSFSAASMMLSPNDLGLEFSPAGCQSFHGQRLEQYSSRCPLPATTRMEEPPPPPGQPTYTTRMSYLPMPDWCEVSPARRSLFEHNKKNIKYPSADSASETLRDSESKKTEQQEGTPVVMRSLLAPCDSRPLFLQTMLREDAEAAALDCDGSLTDDEEDEPFLLADPATLAAERESNNARPSQRRRMSLEDNAATGTTNNVNRSCNLRRPSFSSPNKAPVDHASSATSLLGMAFLRGDSTSSFGQHCKTALPFNPNCDAHESANSREKKRTDEVHMVTRETMSLNRIKSEGSMSPIGLDLEPSPDLNEQDGPRLSDVPDRDLCTPPATEGSSSETSSPPLLDQTCENTPRSHSNHSTRAVDHSARAGGSGSIYISRSDPNNVQMTIAKMVLEQSPPMTCKI